MSMLGHDNNLTSIQLNVIIQLVIADLLQGFLNIVYPPHCCLCQTSLVQKDKFPQAPLCLICEHKMSINRPPFCEKCSRHIKETSLTPLCLTCLRKDVDFDCAWAACLYEEPIKTLIHRFKFQEKTYLRYFFSKLMINFIESYAFPIQAFDIIVPIPLSKTKQRERGYNQSEYLADRLSIHFKMKLTTNILLRTKHISSQSLLNQKERWTNIKGAFRINPTSSVKNKSILLVDDLITTGATASEAASVLKKAGALKVGVITLAITM